MDKFETINTAPIDGTCLTIRHLCTEYDKLNNINVCVNCDSTDARIKKHQKVVYAIKRNIGYLNKLVKSEEDSNEIKWYEISKSLPPAETEIILADSVRHHSEWQNFHRDCNIKDFCEHYGYNCWAHSPICENCKSE